MAKGLYEITKDGQKNLITKDGNVLKLPQEDKTMSNNIFNKLPKYAKAWKWLEFEATKRDYGGYNGVIEALDGDPRKKDHPQVLFKEDTFGDFIWAIRQYKKEYGRVNYDW